MNTRLVSRRALLTTLMGAGAAGAGVAAQPQKPVTPGGALDLKERQVLSGSDIGFRVERVGRDGARVGALVVRVDGKWVEAHAEVGLRTVR